MLTEYFMLKEYADCLIADLPGAFLVRVFLYGCRVAPTQGLKAARCSSCAYGLQAPYLPGQTRLSQALHVPIKVVAPPLARGWSTGVGQQSPCANERNGMLPLAYTLVTMPPAIAAHGLSRSFNGIPAVDHVELTVQTGQFFGFLGPNGAGKSTTIKMLTGLLAPSAGTIQILGQDLFANPVEVKRNIGVVPEGMALFGKLTASEYLTFVGRMYGLDKATTKQRSEELLEFMGLANEPKKMIADYSHGMGKKLALAAAVIHGPKVLFLDEPFEGVDAIAANTLKTMLQNMIHRGATIFLTSHVLEIVERLCSHIAIIHRGHIVATGSLDELRAGVQARSTAGAEIDPHARLTLEEIFLNIVGNAGGAQGPDSVTHPEQELTWLS
jgi:ABC-2 type transport system ATP-binding protein